MINEAMMYKVWAGDEIVAAFYDLEWARPFADMLSEEVHRKGKRVRITNPRIVCERPDED